MAAETNTGSGFHRGGCREDTQSCDGSLGMQPGSQGAGLLLPFGATICWAQTSSRGASTVTSVLQAGNRKHKRRKRGSSQSALLRICSKLSACSSGRTLPPRGSGTLATRKTQGPVTRGGGSACGTNRSSACHCLSARQDGRACPPLYKDETAERRPGGPVQSRSGAVVVTVPIPSSGRLLENGERRRQRLTNICGPTAGVSPGPSPCGESNWQMRGAAEGSEDRGRRTPCSVSSPGWRELDGSGLGSAGRTDGQGFSTASRAAKQQTCLPSLCQPRLRFPLGPSQRQRLKPEDSDSWARAVPFPTHHGGQDEGQRVRGSSGSEGDAPGRRGPPRSHFPVQGRASLWRSDLSPNLWGPGLTPATEMAACLCGRGLELFGS